MVAVRLILLASILFMSAVVLQICCLVLLVSLSVLSSILAQSHVRGVHPADMSKYSVADHSSFACGDGSSISWDRVNDDHCDCASGADEPGTSGEHRFRAHFFFRPHLSRALLSIVFVCIPAFTAF